MHSVIKNEIFCMPFATELSGIFKPQYFVDIKMLIELMDQYSHYHILFAEYSHMFTSASFSNGSESTNIDHGICDEEGIIKTMKMILSNENLLSYYTT